MLLNRLEKALMNNPARALVQRRIEARRLLALGGRMSGGAALEVGCGQGVGAEIILDVFGARRVDAFDFDADMVARARQRLNKHGRPACVWQGDAAAIAAPDRAYEAVFDFGIIHHVLAWRDALKEVRRVLKPGGRFYAEEVLRRFVVHPVNRRLFDHPFETCFDHHEFRTGLAEAGLRVRATAQFLGCVGWFVADRDD